MKKKLLGMILLSTIIVTGCGVPKLKNGEELVAKINGLEVTANDLYKELKKTQGTYATIDLIIDNYIANKEITIDETVNKTIDAQIEMYKIQYEDFESVLLNYGYKNIDEFRKTLIADYKKEQVVINYYKENLTEKEIQQYYDEMISEKLNVRHILIKPEEKSNEEDQKKANEEALKKAKELIEKLNNGDDFAELAKEHSKDSSSSNGGLIEGVTKKGYVSEFFEAAVKLKNNEYTKEPVKSEFGYHVILKVSSTEKPSLKDSTEEIKTDLANKILSDDKEASQKAWVEVRKKYKLEIFDKDVKSLYDATVANLKKDA